MDPKDIDIDTWTMPPPPRPERDSSHAPYVEKDGREWVAMCRSGACRRGSDAPTVLAVAHSEAAARAVCRQHKGETP